MANSFKWLLPGAVKKMTTTKKQNTNQTMLERKLITKPTKKRSTAAFVIFNHLYIHESMHIRTKREKFSFPFLLTNIHICNAYLFT